MLQYLISYCLIYKYSDSIWNVKDLYLKDLKPISTANERVINGIKRQSKLAVKFTYVVLLVLAVNVAMFLPWTGDEDKIFFHMNRFKYYFGDGLLKTYLHLSIFPFLCHATYAATIPVLVIIYYILHIKFQFALLIERVESLNIISGGNLSKLRIYNVNYQRKIFRELVLCIRHHQCITRSVLHAEGQHTLLFFRLTAGIFRFKTKLGEILYWPTLILMSTALLFEASLIIFYLSVSKIGS